MTEVEELKAEIRRLRRKVDAEINTGLIKALNIEPGKKYALFFGQGNGLDYEDISRVQDPAFVDTIFVVNDVAKVELKDKEMIRKHFGL